MYFYWIGYGDYDEYGEEQLIHNEEYTQEEFLMIVNSAAQNNIEPKNMVKYLCDNHGFQKLKFSAGAKEEWEEKKGTYWE